ncbi:ABC transporter ATP-binding protein [Salinarimonas sp.]|uniref:ABC transporter ATP-binding protein n=1 Tax=Salinarimonas sp. TaxID=2766526 RepID=UPI0032D99596
MSRLLEVENLRVTIPTEAGDAPILEGVDLALDRGERLGIVGESGCGKSMTALAVMGLLPKAARVSGAIRLDGRNLLEASEREMQAIRGRRIAMVFQEPMTALNPVKTIGAQIAESLVLHLRLSKAEAAARARELLDRVGLPGPRFSLDLYPHQLSGGQRQRVVIAIALACDPDILVADEPTTALDVTIQAQILDLLRDLVAETGMGLVLITHDLGVVEETAERMMVMYAGRVVESGRTDDVFGHMAHPYTRGLFSASPRSALLGAARDARGRKRRLLAIPGQVPDPLHRPAGCAFAPRCPRAQGDCRIAPPPLAPLGASERRDHRAACLHPHPPAGTADPLAEATRDAGARS